MTSVPVSVWQCPRCHARVERSTHAIQVQCTSCLLWMVFIHNDRAAEDAAKPGQRRAWTTHEMPSTRYDAADERERRWYSEFNQRPTDRHDDRVDAFAYAYRAVWEHYADDRPRDHMRPGGMSADGSTIETNVDVELRAALPMDALCVSCRRPRRDHDWLGYLGGHRIDPDYAPVHADGRPLLWSGKVRVREVFDNCTALARR